MNDAKDNIVRKTDKSSYSDDEINELAEWLDDLTLRQAFYLKESFEAFLQMQAHEYGNGFVH